MIAQLNDLLDAELNSVFAFLGRGMPYVDRAHASMRKKLAAMVTASERRAARLVKLIESLDGSPIPRGLQSGEQHLAYLTIQFLLPKLIAAKERDIERYQSVQKISASSDAAVVLAELIEEQSVELRTLSNSKV